MPLTAFDVGGALEAPEKVDILVVDDLPEKLLAFKTVLEELQQNLVFVNSGTEALREVLTREFAVILLDVNMPDIDGLETATLIRRYKRSAHTPIIFITAYADEMQTARGYSLGAVDYILSPVVPEVLRSKVRVFVELQLLQRRIARQADARVAQAAAEAALLVAEESTHRSAFLSDLSHSLSGLLEVRAGVHKLLSMVVPTLAGAATVALVDAELRVAYAAGWRDGDSAATEYEAGELPRGELERVQQVLHPRLALADLGASVAYPLRDGQRLLGVLTLSGEPTALGSAVLEEVATRAATAFAAAQLYQNLQAEILERRRTEARLEEASKRKDEFLAMLSHELRNPLAPIGNAVEIIRRLGGHDAKLMWANDVTDRQLRQLTRLVDELLDVARIGQGKIVLQTAAVELSALLTQCIELQRPELNSRRQTLTQAMPSGPVWIEADAARLAQVFSNLLNNANKYTPEGGSVHVAAWVEQGQAVISVRDNGIGIEAALLPRVFDLFEQGTRALDRNQGGLGVGLTMVQRLVRLHHGRVEAISAGAGQGADFRVYLPCLQLPTGMPTAAASAPAGTAKRPRRVLIVEDNPDVAETTATMLALAGHTLRCAGDVAQALALAEEFAPEVVLLDVGLPRVDGYQVAQRLRRLPQTRQALLIGLTGYGMPADRQRGREAGFDHHLLKPTDPLALYALIEAWEPTDAAYAAEDLPPTRGDDSAQRPATLYTFKRS
ncbi:MAG TPA: response regulator [Burkholderiaceae bacterium]|nr:response regulator [Burkholderiaceae bacterium]